MTIPRIAVRFEGNSDNVAAAVRALTGELRGLTATQRQTAQASNELAAAGSKVAGQIGSASAALGSLATTLGVARLGRLVQDTIDAGDQIFKLSQKTGASTEALSVLSFAGRTADVSLDDLANASRFLSKSLGELRQGTPQIVAAFRAIGIEAKDLKGLSFDQVLLRIADAQARFADGTGKSEAILRIMGRTATEMIPFLNDLADGGFDRAAEAAQRMGLIWSREAAKGAQDFNDSIQLLKASAEGIAGTFAREVTPAATGFFQGLTKVLTDLPGPTKAVVANFVAIEGAILGMAGAIRILTIAFTAARLTTPVGLIVTALGALASVLLSVSSNSAKAKADYESFLGTLTTTAAVDTERKRLELELATNEAATNATTSTFRRLALLRQREEIERRLSALAERRQTTAAAEKPQVAFPDPAAVTARQAAQRAQIQQELELARAGLRAREALEQRQFEVGNQGLTSFFAHRRRIIQEGIDTEVQALERERAVIQRAQPDDAAGIIKQRQEVTRVTTDILRTRSEGETKLAQLSVQESLQEKALAEQRLSFEQRILQARGLNLQASLDAIEQEARKFEELLVKQDVSRTDRRSLVSEFRTALTLRANIDEATRLAQEGFAEIDAERERITQQVQIGILTERQGQEQLAAFERARLPALRELAVQAQEVADQLGNPELIQQAQALADQVDRIAESADLAAQRMARFASQVADAAERSIQTVLGPGLDQLGQPNPNSGAIQVRERQAAEIQAEIDELNRAAAQGNQQAAVQVRALEAEYESLQGRIAELKAESTDFFDVLRAGFVDLLEGIREVLNQLIAANLVEGLRGTFSRRGLPGAPEGLAGQDIGALAASAPAGEAVQAAVDTTPQVAAAAAVQAAATETTVAAGLLSSAGAAVSASAAPVTGGAAALTGSAGSLSSSGAILLSAAAALQAAAAALAAANAVGAGVPGFAGGGYLDGPGSPTSDSLLIRASRTEFVQPAGAVSYYGVPMMEEIRRRRFPKPPGFAAGGLVGGPVAPATIRTSLTTLAVRQPSVPRAPSIPQDAELRTTALVDGEIRVLLERGMVLDQIRSYMGSREAEESHVRLAGATRSRRGRAGA